MVPSASPFPRLSAIVPALNAAATIAQCLDALTAQASDEVEIIVVDDGSTDDSVEQIANRCGFSDAGELQRYCSAGVPELIMMLNPMILHLL